MLTVLDDPETRRRLDPHGMGESVRGFPEQCAAAARLAWEAPLPLPPAAPRPPRWVLVAGMGGSGIGGLLLAELLAGEAALPVLVNRDYELPAFIGPESLVVASSYSGNTEETLAAYAEARRRGATVVAVTTGGELAARAAADGVPVVRIPPGLMPRAALGYSFVPLLVLLHRLGLAADPSPALAEAGRVLAEQRERLAPEVPEAANPAKQLARSLHGRLPFFYGSRSWTGAVAYRWKCQLNENAKNLAVWNTLPELDHNELVGWEAPPELAAQARVVFLRDPDEPPAVRRRVQVTAGLLEPRVQRVEEVWAPPAGPLLARMLGLVYLGDWVSYYLALLNGVDPFPVSVIDRLKAALAAAPAP